MDEFVEFEQWKVYKNGDMDCEKAGYTIHADQLRKEDWILHMMEKRWVDFNDFIPAYFYAMKIAGIEFKSERISY